jgi:S-adenosyl methyltransferase
MESRHIVVRPFDPGTPSIARIWDYWLGGKDNFAVDRELADKMLRINPLAARTARENRQFLGRAVSYGLELVPARGWEGSAQHRRLAARRLTFLAGAGQKNP